MAGKKADDEVRGIKRHDLWRWMATLDTAAASERDNGHISMAGLILMLYDELKILVCPEDD